MTGVTKKGSTALPVAKSSIASSANRAGSATSWSEDPRDILNRYVLGYLKPSAKAAQDWLIALSQLDSWQFLGALMQIDPDLEAFFVAVALQHGTHPKPLFGIERNNLVIELTAVLSSHQGEPEVMQKVRRNYAELGGRLLSQDPQWFYSKLAEAYLEWLYSQEESKRLLPDALTEAEHRRGDPTNPFQRRTIKW